MPTSPFMFAFTPPAPPAVTTPTAVANLILQVDGEIEALNNDIAAALRDGKIHVSDDWVIQRNSFYKEWKLFATSYTGGGFLVTLPGDAWDQTGQYQSKNEVWRQKFIDVGGKPTGPGPQERPAGTDVAGAVKWGAAAIIVLVAGYGAYKVFR